MTPLCRARQEVKTQPAAADTQTACRRAGTRAPLNQPLGRARQTAAYLYAPARQSAAPFLRLHTSVSLFPLPSLESASGSDRALSSTGEDKKPCAAMEAVLPAAQHDGLHAAAFGPMPFGLRDGRFSSPNLLTNGGDLFWGGYYPTRPFGIVPVHCYSASPSPRAASWSRSSFDASSVLGVGDDSPAALARLALQYQEAAGRYHLFLSHLVDTTYGEVALRRENDLLRSATVDLVRRIVLVGGKHSSAIALADELRRLTHADQQAMPPPPLPPFVMRPVPAETPKSISIRSAVYLKMKQSGKHRVSKTTDADAQRVFVGMDGAAKEEGKKGAKEELGAGGLEFEVYTQGMFKTELCNKWEATGACSYGDLCQFAHGIAQLRPVIRHPRYKTKVCRTVLTGILCPYGHRCHFRHSITPADGHLLRP